MGRPPCCDKVGIKKGPWTPEEDNILVSYIQEHGPGNWRSLPTNTGLSRCGKSCRLRWTNYLRPGIKRGNFTSHEEVMIIHLQTLLGNKWAAIASYLPQRTDNDIKNYWNTHLKKKLKKLQPASELPHMAQGSSVTPCQIVSKSSNDRRSCLDFGASSNSTTNLNLNQTTSTYASSTENISRLLEGWMMRSSSPKTAILEEVAVAAQQEQQWNQSNSFDNNDSTGSCSSAAAAAAAINSLQGGYCYRSKDEKEGGDLISNEEFESILSFENMNSVPWDESYGQAEEMNQMMELSSIF